MTHEDDLVEIVTKPCPFCVQQHYVTVDIEGLQAWEAGAFVQVAFPSMPADVREMLISGTCPYCWEKHIKPLDEED